jgi:hypothetical protein
MHFNVSTRSVCGPNTELTWNSIERTSEECDIVLTKMSSQRLKLGRLYIIRIFSLKLCVRQLKLMRMKYSIEIVTLAVRNFSLKTKLKQRVSAKRNLRREEVVGHLVVP